MKNKASEDARPRLWPDQREWKFIDGHQRATIFNHFAATRGPHFANVAKKLINSE